MNDSRNRRVCKVKIGKDSIGREMVTIKIEQPDQVGDFTAILMECRDIPHPDLRKALENMGDHLIEHCEFPSTWRHDIAVIGVTITHTNDIQGLVITGKKELKYCNAPLIINSPHYTREPYNEDDDSDMAIFTGECGDHLDTLEKEALAYVDGKRAQLELGLEEKPDEPAPVQMDLGIMAGAALE